MEPKKAYLVSSGEYSDYQVAEVFLDKAAAEKYCAVHNTENKYCDSYRIEEYDINDGSKIDVSESDQILWYYSAYVPVISYGSRKGELGDIIFHDKYDLLLSCDDRQPNTWKIIEDRRVLITSGYYIAVYLDHEDNVLASKIIQDRWNEYKAELEGVKL